MCSDFGRATVSILGSITLWAIILTGAGTAASSNREMAMIVDPAFRLVTELDIEEYDKTADNSFEVFCCFGLPPVQDRFGLLLFLIIGVSCSAITIERVIYCATEMQALKSIRPELERTVQFGCRPLTPAIPEKWKDSDTAALARALITALETSGPNVHEIFYRIEAASLRVGLNFRARLKRGLSLLSILMVVAPVFGLMITIWDIRVTCYEIKHAEARSLAAFAGSLGNSVWFTAAGLALSLFVFLAQSWINVLLGRLENEIRAFLSEIVFFWLDSGRRGNAVNSTLSARLMAETDRVSAER